MTRFIPISTDAAPPAIGTYSQALRHGNTIYLSGQIALDPHTLSLVSAEIEAQIHQVFRNLSAVCEAAGGSLGRIIKLTVYLVNMQHFQLVNEAMANLFAEPYPARAAIGVASLPRGALVEIDAIMILEDPA